VGWLTAKLKLKRVVRKKRNLLILITTLILIGSVLFVASFFGRNPTSSTYETVNYEVNAPRMQSEWLIVKVSGPVVGVSISNNASPAVMNLTLPKFSSLADLNDTYIGFLFFNISRWYGSGYHGCTSIWLNMTASPPTAYCAYSSAGIPGGNEALGTYEGPWPVYDDTGRAYNFKVNYGWYQDANTGLLYIHYTTFDSNFALISVMVKRG